MCDDVHPVWSKTGYTSSTYHIYPPSHYLSRYPTSLPAIIAVDLELNHHAPSLLLANTKTFDIEGTSNLGTIYGVCMADVVSLDPSFVQFIETVIAET